MNFFDDPLSESFIYPREVTPKGLVRYMIAEQQKFFGQTILDEFKQAILIRNMKLLLADWSAQDIKMAIALSARKADHPFSTKFVEDTLKWLTALRNCPILVSLRSKS